ncbi:MAG TPA: amidohydrolase family protein [Gemmatimonadaceae bacterium]|nr:amidohydrolase family protein [Gemmatimonadaceae bacterium]
MRVVRTVLVLSLCGSTTGIAQGSGTIALVDANVVPMDRDTVLARQTVLIRDGHIQLVGPNGRVRIPAGATRIETGGKYLIPGLADMHVHMVGPRALQVELLKMYVVNGVTSILNMRGTPDHLALRSDIRAGRVLGPSLYTVGRFVNAPFFVTPDSVEQEVVAQKRAGYDFIKMHGELSREAYARLNAVAKREGIRVIGHAPRTLGIGAVFAERQYALAHAEEFLYDTTGSSRDVDLPKFEPRIPQLARGMLAADIWLMPNLTAYKNIGLMAQDLPAVLARPEMEYLPAAVEVGWRSENNPYTRRFGPDKAPGILARHALLQKLTKAFDSAGVKLLVGTDGLNVGTVPGFSAHDELQELVEAGLSPYHALRAATANASAFLGSRPCIGQVRAGCVADLVLLDASPLTSINNARRISGVMVRGQWLSREELNRILESLEAGGR